MTTIIAIDSERIEALEGATVTPRPEWMPIEQYAATRGAPQPCGANYFTPHVNSCLHMPAACPIFRT